MLIQRPAVAIISDTTKNPEQKAPVGCSQNFSLEHKLYTLPNFSTMISDIPSPKSCTLSLSNKATALCISFKKSDLFCIS